MKRHITVRKIAVASAAAALVSGTVQASDLDRRCETSPQLVGPCFTIRGRLFAANGTPGIRIWRIGTKRVLGVVPPEEEIAPKALLDRLSFGTRIYGDLKVCPLTSDRDGYMQMVCIEAATNLVAETFDPKSPSQPPVYSRLADTSLN